MLVRKWAHEFLDFENKAKGPKSGLCVLVGLIERLGVPSPSWELGRFTIVTSTGRVTFLFYSTRIST
jgi:hypothetical protein